MRIRKEEEIEHTYDEIKSGVFFRGHNLWLLVLAMCIACVGLNSNNIAAVIGAMLISPLMGPIIGLGFGFGIGSKTMVQTSLYNWGIMVVTSLIASTLYFLISPFDFATDQLNNFKEASVFDVLLALFGGFAGFLGITRKEAIKVIAGVAVATACIPPLCTAGYGLATLQWEYFAGGLYFYLINCFFIGLGTWILSISLGYRASFVQINQANKKATIWLIILAIVLITPSIWLATKKWQRESIKRSSELLVSNLHQRFPQLVIIGHEVFEQNGRQNISLSVLNDRSSLPDSIMLEAQSFSKDLIIQWHYAPDNARNDLELLKKQLEQMEKKYQKIDSIMNSPKSKL